MKTCEQCGVDKPLIDFYAHAQSAQGRLRRCKLCMIAASREKKPLKVWPTVMERFNKKIHITPGCWLWLASKDSGGYGLLNISGKQEKAHRVSYRLFVGNIPDGLQVCHRCDTPACVNPDHLFVGTNKENMEDRERKGRGVRQFGENHHSAKLTMEIARSIRADRRRQRDIGAQYGVSQHTVWQIKQNKIWREV